MKPMVRDAPRKPKGGSTRSASQSRSQKSPERRTSGGGRSRGTSSRPAPRSKSTSTSRPSGGSTYRSRAQNSRASSARARPDRREKPSRSARDSFRGPVRETERKPRSVWDEEAQPTLFTMPILCAIIAMILAMGCVRVFHFYTFNLSVDGTVIHNGDDFSSKISVNYKPTYEVIKQELDGEQVDEKYRTYLGEVNETDGEFYDADEDEHGIIPFFQRLNWMVSGVAILSMLTAVMTVFTRRSMVPFNTEGITTGLALMMILLSIGTALYCATAIPQSVDKYHEDRVEILLDDQNRTVNFDRSLFGTHDEKQVLVLDPYYEPGYVTPVDGEIHCSYYPGPAWFIMLIILPAMALAAYHYQAKENAGEDQAISNFMGDVRSKFPKEEKEPKRPAPMDLRDPTLDEGARGRRGRGRGRARAGPSAGGSRYRPAGPYDGPGVRGKGAADPEFMKLVAQYKKFTGKQRLSSNELAKLKAMAAKKKR